MRVLLCAAGVAAGVAFAAPASAQDRFAEATMEVGGTSYRHASGVRIHYGIAPEDAGSKSRKVEPDKQVAASSENFQIVRRQGVTIYYSRPAAEPDGYEPMADPAPTPGSEAFFIYPIGRDGGRHGVACYFDCEVIERRTLDRTDVQFVRGVGDHRY